MKAIVAAAWLLTSSSAGVSGVDVKIEASPVLEDRFPQATVNFPTNIEALPDLVYSVPPGFRPLRLDLYKSRDAGSGSHGKPLVIYIHGGGWQAGHTRHSGAFGNWPAVLASLAARGYVVASIEYRLSGEAPFPAAIHDVKTSIRWLRSKSAQFGIDPARVMIWGGSAGGQLAALAATSCNVEALTPTYVSRGPQEAPSPLASQSDCVQGLVTWYGVFDFVGGALSDLADRNANSPVQKYLGCPPADCRSTATLASPVSHLDVSDPPGLLIHGALDKVVPAAQSRLFHETAKSKGVQADLLVIEGVDHSFIGSNPEDTRRASMRALTATFAFFDAVAKPQRKASASR